jgi:2-(1,2-epoxy-1,2-dihydrophenyl)acetyl-CoA isomerase
VPDIVVDRCDRIAVVRLNRPSRGNSVTPTVVAQLGDTVHELCRDESADGIVITGTGRVFCAGADVREMYHVFIDSGPDGLCGYLADVWMPAVQQTVRKLWHARKPVVAAVNGAATAGGLDFALTCDARIAVPSARFAESYANLGMVPVAGGGFLLPLVIGLPAATAMLASGELIDAERALQLALVESLHSPEQLVDAAAGLARRLASGPSTTFAEMKRIARQHATPQLEATLTESLQANISLIARDEVRQRIVAVMEKYVAIDTNSLSIIAYQCSELSTNSMASHSARRKGHDDERRAPRYAGPPGCQRSQPGRQVDNHHG